MEHMQYRRRENQKEQKQRTANSREPHSPMLHAIAPLPLRQVIIARNCYFLCSIYVVKYYQNIGVTEANA